MIDIGSHLKMMSCIYYSNLVIGDRLFIS